MTRFLTRSMTVSYTHLEHLHIPDYQAEIDASYAHGSIGRAKKVATSQEFADMTQNALRDVYKRQVLPLVM